MSLEGFNSKRKLWGTRICKHKLYPQRFCKPTNQEKKECIKIKSFLESGSPLSTLTHTKNGNVGRREEKSKKIFFRRERKGREAQKHRSKNAENQSQGENPGSSPRKMTLHIQGNPTKLTSDFLAKTLEDNGIKYSKLKEKKNCQPGILYPAKSS